jgi:hypothetical protein
VLSFLQGMNSITAKQMRRYGDANILLRSQDIFALNTIVLAALSFSLDIRDKRGIYFIK